MSSQHEALPDNYGRQWCSIHGEHGHLHRAVCSACLRPLQLDDGELLPTCWHPAAGDYVRWRCWEGLPMN